jgi:histidine triad (HIT) family protein
MSDTLFTKILKREIPGTIVYEDDRSFAIRDINPKAPTHILVIPKQVIPRVGDATASDEAVLGHLLTAAAQIARNEGVDKTGYRLVINNGRDAGESVPHLHVHLLGGRPMAWPPG